MTEIYYETNCEIGNIYNTKVTFNDLDQNSKDYYKIKHQVPKISKEEFENATEDKQNEYFIGLILGGYIPKESLLNNNLSADYWYKKFDKYLNNTLQNKNSIKGDYFKEQVELGNIPELALKNTDNIDVNYWYKKKYCKCDVLGGLPCDPCKKNFYKIGKIFKLRNDPTSRIYYRLRNNYSYYIRLCFEKCNINYINIKHEDIEKTLRENLTKIKYEFK